VKVKPSAKKEGVSVNANGMLEVAVAAPPEKGKANERLTELLAEHFGLAKKSHQNRFRAHKPLKGRGG